MGDPSGFIEYDRESFEKDSVPERVQHHNEFLHTLPIASLQKQGARCMDCGVPFCHTGCPLGNIIPDFNDFVYRGLWEAALGRLHATNNFPEFTGRVCPAPCETSCVLGINEDPVAIKQIEVAIADRGFEEGWIQPVIPETKTNKSVAIVGSGPAGLAAAQQLCRAGHAVTVYERADRPGGLLMYGIPDFKLEKHRVLRRVEQLKAEGVSFVFNTEIGVDLTAEELKNTFDAVLLCGGSTRPRDLPIPGREGKGVHFAMEFLPQQNKRNQGDTVPEEIAIHAEGKDVIVIGGGDTGSDCVGTSIRQGCKSVVQLEIMPMPPDLGPYPRQEERPDETPWPQWPVMLRTSTSHEEGVDRFWSVLTKKFQRDAKGGVSGLETVEIEWVTDEDGRKTFQETSGTEKTWPAQLIFLAMGFLGPETKCGIDPFQLELDPRGNVQCNDEFMTSKPGVFAAGDMRRGQSLVVWAIHEGREAARAVDKYLQGYSNLPSADAADFIWS